MSSESSPTATDIAAALRSTVRKGQGMRVPYARRWEVGGCEPIHSLHSYPYDGVQVLSDGLSRLAGPVSLTENGVRVGDAEFGVWVAANRSIRGEGPPDAYLLGCAGEPDPRYAGNSPEVILALLERLSSPVPSIPTDREIQVGFPGLPDPGVTYVGSWQWNIHGEVRDDEFVRRAAAATLATIRSKEVRDAE